MNSGASDGHAPYRGVCQEVRWWTPHEDAVLVSKWGGLAARRIGTLLGRSKNSVIRRYHILKRHRRRGIYAAVPSLPRVTYLELND